MLILLLILPTTIYSRRLQQCVQGYQRDNHNLTDLKLYWCSSTAISHCYTQRTRLEDDDQHTFSFMYGCGLCATVHTPPDYLERECQECDDDECNTPHEFWGMEYAEFPNEEEEEPVKNFVSFREGKSFSQYEAMAEPFLWALPVAILGIVLCLVVYTIVWANASAWYSECVRFMN